MLLLKIRKYHKSQVRVKVKEKLQIMEMEVEKMRKVRVNS
jgi:hypothetical protein